MMSLLVTAAASEALQLRAVRLAGLVGGWQQVGCTADTTLAHGPVTLQKGDVHALTFFLLPPPQPLLAPLSVLEVDWRRAGPPDSREASTSGADGESDGARVAQACRLPARLGSRRR